MTRLSLSCYALALVLLAPATAAAQVSVAIGAKLGLNVADVSVSPSEPTDSRTAFAGGASLSIRVLDAFAIQPELLYSQQGAGSSEDGVTAFLNQDYLTIPVLAKVVFPIPESAVRPILYVGPYVGPALAFEISCSFSAR